LKNRDKLNKKALSALLKKLLKNNTNHNKKTNLSKSKPNKN
jgi:hypothetical protein